MSDILYNNLNNESIQIIQDDKIKIKLKEHQKTAIYAMMQFENNGIVLFTKKAYIQNYHIYTESEYSRYSYIYPSRQNKFKEMKFEIESNYGILADKVGSGKTFETMGLITYAPIPKERDRIISSSIYSVTKYKDPIHAFKTNLIIVPHNIIFQWKTTFEYSTINTYIIAKHTDIEYLTFEENIFKEEKPVPDADFNESHCIEYYDCIIISATMFEHYYKKFKDIKYARIIIDEIVSIKLPMNIEFKCNFIWFLTATPSGIRTVKRNYIRSLVYTINDYIINNIIIKNNDDYVDESMKLPSINQIIVKCLTPKELNIIKGYVDGEILTMINAGNIQEAITKLNCNIETSDNILEVVTKKIKKELYNKKQELEYEQKRIPDDTKTHEEKLKKIQLKISELESKYKGIEDRIKSFKEESCPICFDDLDIPMLTPCCNNLFCVKCLTNCNKCPMCRENLSISKCLVINDETNNKSNDKLKTKTESKLCSKIDNFITLLKAKPNGKYIVFSNYDKTFDDLYKVLLENNISNSRLIGSNLVINNIIKKFDMGEIKVLMLNALNYGSGINLQMATDIIIYHELNIELETQVIGRAQRLGRTSSLNVYYLLNDNEKINCNNPTLNLDIFDNDKQNLDEHIKSSSNINKEIQSEAIILKKTKKTKGPTKKKPTIQPINTIIDTDSSSENELIIQRKKK